MFGYFILTVLNMWSQHKHLHPIDSPRRINTILIAFYLPLIRLKLTQPGNTLHLFTLYYNYLLSSQINVENSVLFSVQKRYLRLSIILAMLSFIKSKRFSIYAVLQGEILNILGGTQLKFYKFMAVPALHYRCENWTLYEGSKGLLVHKRETKCI